MATKKKPKAAQEEAVSGGLTQNQSALVTLMSGVYAQHGMPFAAAQKALEGKGDAGQELNALQARGLVFQTGDGKFALTRDTAGNYAALTGQQPVMPAGYAPPQATQAAPAQAAPPAQQPPAPMQAAPPPAAPPIQQPPAPTTAEGGGDVEDDDLPWWTSAQFQQAAIERLDEIVRLLGGISKALGAGATPTTLLSSPQAPEAAQAPAPSAPVPTWPQAAPAPATQPQQAYGSPPYPAQQPPPTTYVPTTAPPPSAPMQQPWQQPQFQNAPTPYAAPGQPPAPTYGQGYQGGPPPPPGQPQQTYGYAVPGQPPPPPNGYQQR